MHSFSSIYTALIKTFSVLRIVYSEPYERIYLEVEFSLFLFHFLHSVHFICLKGSLNARTSVSREKVSTEFDCREFM